MKYVLTIVAVATYLIAVAAPAFAACPYGTTYRCYQGFNGKVICGCS